MLETLIYSLILNLLMFIIAYIFKTDKLTDISYAITFLGIALFGLLENNADNVQKLAFLVVAIWAFRLGIYLLIRIHFMGRDKRFDEMRNSFWKFGRFWLLQGLTAWVVMLPATLLLQKENSNFGLVPIIGLVLSFTGLFIETIADIQKFKFIKNKSNKNKWIDSGIWKYSRHPNYFGEIIIWVGVYMVTLLSLSNSEKLIGLLGPTFITMMLLFISGVPILEKSADKKWGNDKNYILYKKNTSLLVPLPKLGKK